MTNKKLIVIDLLLYILDNEKIILHFLD